MCNLIQGPDARRKNSDEDLVKIKSLCSDIIFIISKGRIRPSKHLTLGMALKSLTSSRKVLTILNRYGHTINYTLAEELETEVTYSSIHESRLIPSGISPVGNRSTNIAYDNYDRFVETLSGKDTLHDTVGIIYQFTENDTDNESTAQCESEVLEINESVEESNILSTSRSSSSSSKAPKKRRKLEEITRDIQPYYKKPCAKTNLMPYNNIIHILQSFKMHKLYSDIKNIVWALSVSQIPSTPMWIGFNNNITIDNSRRQIVDYLPQINSSPTSYTIVHETMIQAVKIAQECHQEHILVTYDLAIARMAMQIQLTEKPKFDNLFINLGAFHTEMAFFKALGKYIDSSGIIDILVQSEALAQGSTNGFIDGKHFNRCKRLHPLFSAALQSLHIKEFLSNYEVDYDILLDDLKHISNNPVENNNPLNVRPSLDIIINDYLSYAQLSLSGVHGKTAQFYMRYIYFVNIFFSLSRSIRNSDFELYVLSLYEMTNLFFAMNQPNYARWTIYYVSNLLNLKSNNSPLLEEFTNGAFGIKRTNNTFSRAPVDLTIEQTINADAANCLTGISHFTNSISARQRWALSHSIRTKIISVVLDELKMTVENDTIKELDSYRINKDRKCLETIIDTINRNINPFSKKIDKENLFNIVTGRAACYETAFFLLNVNNLGEEQKEAFIKGCNDNSDRFEAAIKRNVIKNFASECIKKPQKSKDGQKQVLIAMERDIFGRLLAIALDKKIDMAQCLSYPLSPAPPALAGCTGEMHKTDKSALTKVIRGSTEYSPPSRVDVDVIDGFYFLYHLGPSIPQTFDKIAELILSKICNTTASAIHIIFDQYFIPSIKDTERSNRHEIDVPYTISGPSQKRPSDFYKSLKNIKFKEALITFISEYWYNNSIVPFLRNKKVYITNKSECFSFQTVNDAVMKTVEQDFICNHEEADTRIIYHLNKLEKNSNVMVKASDTDILVILLGNIHKLIDLEIYLCTIGSKPNIINFINCNQLATTLGDLLCRALPGFHAYTGCDYTASFYKKGKVKPFKELKKNKQVQQVFANLNNIDVIDNFRSMEILQQYTCKLYGINCNSVNDARLFIFQNKFAPTSAAEYFMRNVKKFDSTQIPPCWNSLKQKILRTIYVTSMWQNATEANCVNLSLEECGWTNDNNKIEPFWFESDPTPLLIEDIVSVEIEHNEIDHDTDDYNNDNDDNDDNVDDFC